MDIEREIRRLKRTQASLSTIAWLGIIVVLAWFAFSWLRGSYRELSVVREGDTVHLRANNDGPYVVTHLTVQGWDVGFEGEKRVAALDPPLAIIDSAGGQVEHISKLNWTNFRGEPAEPPSEDTKLTVLYFQPQFAKLRASQP